MMISHFFLFGSAKLLVFGNRISLPQNFGSNDIFQLIQVSAQKGVQEHWLPNLVPQKCDQNILSFYVLG